MLRIADLLVLVAGKVPWRAFLPILPWSSPTTAFTPRADFDLDFARQPGLSRAFTMEFFGDV